MLLNEFLKEHRKVEEQGVAMKSQQATIEELKAAVAQQQTEFSSSVTRQQREIETLMAALKAQAAQIQKVSAQLEAVRSAPRIVSTNE